MQSSSALLAAVAGRRLPLIADPLASVNPRQHRGEMETFRYFADPIRFSHLADAGTPCDFCASTDPAFDGGGYFGARDVGAICPRCLRSGKLAEIDVSTNEVTVGDLPRLLGSEDRARGVVREIECCTPALPTWQDREWPFVNGEFPRFLKIASRVDFVDKLDLYETVPESERLGHDADALWEMLPEARITSIADGNYDTSFYLFEHSKGKLCTWDCN